MYVSRDPDGHVTGYIPWDKHEQLEIAFNSYWQIQLSINYNKAAPLTCQDRRAGGRTLIHEMRYATPSKFLRSVLLLPVCDIFQKTADCQVMNDTCAGAEQKSAPKLPKT